MELALPNFRGRFATVTKSTSITSINGSNVLTVIDNLNDKGGELAGIIMAAGLVKLPVGGYLDLIAGYFVIFANAVLMIVCGCLALNAKLDTFTEYRTKRIAAGITLNNLNREHAYLRAVFNELNSLGHWKKDNPLAKLRQFKIPERELSFLTLDQIDTLLKSLVSPNNRHTLLISKVCLATGARWGEAEMLKTSQLRGNVIQFAKTKSGKVRAVPISEDLRKELLAHHDPKETGNRIFANAYSAFREAIERAKIELPEGQLTHVLRHTFASHFMMRGGNILTLNKILGHASLAMTMRYAHLAPEHLQEAIHLNPLAPAARPKAQGRRSASKVVGRAGFEPATNRL